jgi:hypothetical protein
LSEHEAVSLAQAVAPGAPRLVFVVPVLVAVVEVFVAVLAVLVAVLLVLVFEVTS